MLSEKDRDNILAFQRFAGRRIQRFPQRSLNLTSFYGLGWIRLTTFLLVKKLLFILTIMRMDANNIVRQVLNYRSDKFMQDVDGHSINSLKSPIFDLLNAARRLGLLNTVVGMINGTIPLYSKKRWSKYMWSQAWKLEDNYWLSITTINRDCQYLTGTIGQVRYLTWWYISDKFPSTIKYCENLAKIVCKASRLKTDDYRLKGLPPSHRVCGLCDDYVTENIEHLVLQCPHFENRRKEMLKEINDLTPQIGAKLRQNPERMMGWLLGGTIEDMPPEVMLK